jgi:hypothetical protein
MLETATTYKFYYRYRYLFYSHFQHMLQSQNLIKHNGMHFWTFSLPVYTGTVSVPTSKKRSRTCAQSRTIFALPEPEPHESAAQHQSFLLTVLRYNHKRFKRKKPSTVNGMLIFVRLIVLNILTCFLVGLTQSGWKLRL